MDTRLTRDITLFAALAGPVLRSERYTANVIAVQVQEVLSGRRALPEGSTWILVEEDGRAVGAAMHTPPHNLFLPRLDPGVPEAIADALLDAGVSFRGVAGERPTAERFLRRWEARGGSGARLDRSMRMYLLDRLEPPIGVPGGARRAAEGDQALVTAWMTAFRDESMPDAPEEDFAIRSAREIGHGHLWIWEVEGDAVSMAGVSPPAAGVARVGPVYTPPVRRRRGYGAAVTARATRAVTDAGAADVVLYTDLANPTSNAIYRSIGYVPHHDSGEWVFV